jgi:hypothetical protein
MSVIPDDEVEGPCSEKFPGRKIELSVRPVQLYSVKMAEFRGGVPFL